MKRGNRVERPRGSSHVGRYHARAAGRKNHWIRDAKYSTDRNPWAHSYKFDYYDASYVVRHRSRPSLLSNGGKP
jgi:hypothetical protein